MLLLRILKRKLTRRSFPHAHHPVAFVNHFSVDVQSWDGGVDEIFGYRRLLHKVVVILGKHGGCSQGQDRKISIIAAWTWQAAEWSILIDTVCCCVVGRTGMHERQNNRRVVGCDVGIKFSQKP